MSADTDLVTSEREALRQYADWYSRQGYQVSVEPSPRELPEFLRTLAPDVIARRDGENIVVEIKTSSPALRTGPAAGQGIGAPRRLEAAGGPPIWRIRNGRRPRSCPIFQSFWRA